MTTTESRVQRRRRATIDEIIEVSRAQLRAGEDVTISSVAAALGMTPPALYRYVPNLAGLTQLINKSILMQVIKRLNDAADRHTDPAARLTAAATAFRQWALNNHAEFRSVFAPRDPLATIPGKDDPPTASEIASGIFANVLIEVIDGVELKRPSQPVPPAFSAVLPRVLARRSRAVGLNLKVEPWVEWMFERAWVKFLGVVSFEVFGFLEPEVVVSGDMFVSELLDIGRMIGLDSRLDHLIQVAVETADWTNEVDEVQPLHITSVPRTPEG